MPPAAFLIFLHPQNAPKSLADGASLNQLNNDSWIKGLLLREGEKGGEEKGREWEERRGNGRRREGLRTLTMLETD